MLQSFTSQSLRAYNTFGIDVEARHFVAIQSVEQARQLSAQHTRPILVLGGGSNILFTRDPEAAVWYNRILGKEIVSSTKHEIRLRVGGGENWHQLVTYTLDHDWGGLENLSLIPGTVGASPIQNIGAYGVELASVFDGLDAIELATGRILHFAPESCEFAYRNSVFKQQLRGQLLITHVYFRLSRKQHTLHTEYGAIRQMLSEWEINEPTIQDISRAVIHIRRSKLPDPEVLGNAGSFFKNPELEADQFLELQHRFPHIVSYPLPDGRAKVPAGWLIDQCGWRGRRIGPVGCYEKQALVLVNYGGAEGTDVLALAQRVMASVEDKFGIHLETEVNIL